MSSRILALCIAFALPPAARLMAQSSPPRASEPVPIRRILVPAANVPQELERARRGILLSLPVRELDEKLQEAARAAARGERIPKLVRAAYSAQLRGIALVQGRGQWQVRAGENPALLPLDGFNLALSKAKTTSGADAVLGEINGKEPAVLVEKDTDILFDWSARGTAGPEGIRFDLRFPPAPSALLELKVPIDHEVVLPDESGLLVGPLPAEKAGWRIWRIGLTGKPRLELLVRRNFGPEKGSVLLLSQARTRFEAAPGSLKAEFDFQVEILHAALKELAFECDADLEPYEISARNVDVLSWERLPIPDRNPNGNEPKKCLLVVRLRDSFQGTVQSLRIACLGPPPSENVWTVPGMWLKDGISRGERMILRLEASLGSPIPNPGEFRVVRTFQEGNGFRELQLEAGRIGKTPSARPSLSFDGKSPGPLIEQRSVWRPGPKGQTFETTLNVRALFGDSSTTVLRLPQGGPWKVASLETDPPNLVHHREQAGNRLVLHFLKFPGSTSLRLSLTLRQDRGRTEEAILPIPDLAWEGAAGRSGTLALAPEEGWQVRMMKSPLPPEEPTDTEIDTDDEPALFWRFRGTPPSGTVRILPPKPMFRTAVRQQIRIENRSWSANADVLLEPRRGFPRHLDLVMAGRSQDRWRLLPTGIPLPELRLERLPEGGLANRSVAPGGLSDGNVPVPLPPGTAVWRLHLDGTTAEPVKIVLAGEGRFPDAGERTPPLLGFLFGNPWEKAMAAAMQFGESVPESNPSWTMPLVGVQGGENRESTYEIHGEGAKLDPEASTGLRETGRKETNDTEVVTFRGEDHPGVPALKIRVRPRHHHDHVREICPEAEILTRVRSDLSLLTRFRFAWQAQNRTDLPVRIPGDVDILSIRTNGRWLTEMEVEKRKDCVLVRFRSNPEKTLNRFEIVYAAKRNASSWWPWSSVEAKIPELPSAPLSVRRRWLLDDRLLPLRQENLARRPGSPTRLLLPPSPQEIWSSGRRQAASLIGISPLDPTPRFTRSLMSSIDGLRPPSSESLTLGRLLETVFLDELKDARLLVVDRLGLTEAGLHPSFPLPSEAGATVGSMLKGLDLHLVPWEHRLILTVRDRKDDIGYGLDADTGPALDLFGADRTGTLSSLAVWLGEEPEKDQMNSEDGPFSSLGNGWTEWIPLAGREDEQLMVISKRPLEAGAFVLSLLAVALCWKLRRTGARNRWRLLVLLAGGLLAGSIWLPASLQPLMIWPLAALAGTTCLWSFPEFAGRSSTGPHHGTTIRRPRRGPSTALPCLLILGTLLSAGAQTESPAPAPFTVLLLQEPAKGEPLALVPPALLAKLEEIRSGNELARYGTVPIAVHLQGQAAPGGGSAEFLVRIDLHNFADRVSWHLPLGGAELLEGALLDGAPVFPVVTPAPRNGFSLVVEGKGFHRLTLPITVRSSVAGDHREIRLALPRTPRTSLEMTAAKGMGPVQVINAQGQDETDRIGEKSIVRADVGREGAIHLRWKSEALPTPASPLEVKELYLWDLRPMAGSLKGILAYSAGGTGVNQLTVVLPEKVEVRELSVRKEAAGGWEPVPTKRWYLTGKGNERRLHLETARSTIGKFQVVLDLVPLETGEAGPIPLRLPLPLKARPTDGVLAYRSEGVEAADKTFNLGITGLLPDRFAQVWAAAGQPEGITVTRAYGYRRTSGQAGMNLILTPRKTTVRREVSWKVGRNHADFDGVLEIFGPKDGPSFLEMELPASCELAELTGPGVHFWTRRNDRVQIWSQATMAKASIRVRGWTRLPAPKGKNPPEFRPQFPQVLGTTTTETTLKISTFSGIRLENRRSHGWRSEPAPAGSEATIFRTNQDNAAAVFAVLPAPTLPVVRLGTRLEKDDETWRISVDGRCLAAGSGQFEILLPGSGEEARLEADGPGVRRVGPGRWMLRYGPETPRPMDFRLAARAPRSDRNQPLELVGPSTVGCRETRQWCVAPTSRLEVEPGPGLTRAKVPPTWLRGSETDRENVAFWKTAGGPWSLKLRENAGAPTLGRTVLGADLLVRRKGPAWWYRAQLSLAVGTDFRLEATLPPGAAFAAATLDGRPVMASPDAAGHLRIPIGKKGEPRQLSLFWAAYSDRPENPGLAAPRMADLGPIPWLVRLEVPNGFRLPEHAAPTDAILRSASLNERTRWFAWLADHPPADGPGKEALAQAAKAVRGSLDRIDRLEKSKGFPTQGQGPREWREKARSIRKEAEKRSENYPAPPPFGETVVPAGLLGYPREAYGPTAVWWTEGPLAPVLLQDETAARRSGRRMASDLLVIVVFGLMVVTCLPGLRPLLQAVWPELLMLAALLGTLAWGWSPLGVLLGGAGILARLTVTLAWLKRRSARLFRGTGVEMAGSASFRFREVPPSHENEAPPPNGG